MQKLDFTFQNNKTLSRTQHEWDMNGFGNEIQL